MKLPMNKGAYKANVKRVTFHVLAICWMIVIFCFSAQPGEESGNLSESFTYWLVRFLESIFDFGWDELKLLEITELIGYPIRKIAHMTEFGILSVLVFAAWGTYESLRIEKRRYLAALLFTFFYAMTDEIHQLFVPNRYGCFTDVLVDTAGAIVALGILYCVIAIIRKIKSKINL